MRVGSSISKFKAGDRVCFITLGTYKTVVRIFEQCVAHLPDQLSFIQGAAIPVVYCTAYYSLYYLGRLLPSDSVLIHSGAGGVGQAAIQLAHLKGAKIYATVGTQDKKEFLLKQYPYLQADQIWVGRGSGVALWLKSMVNGVDVVLNSYFGSGLRGSFECLLPFGRFIDISKTDTNNFERLSMTAFARSITYASLDLTVAYENSRSMLQETLSKVMKLHESNSISPPAPLFVYSTSEIESAFRFLQSGESTGKGIIDLREGDQVKVTPAPPPQIKFDSEATYLLIGGFGGLGRSMANWMIQNGTKHLVLLSRSGIKDESDQKYADYLRSQGAQVICLACDITNDSALGEAIKGLADSMPPIKGCIQGAMVLKDRLFETMSLEEWHIAVSPKVKGTLNLHKHLPLDMDFFILLSSAAGVLGARGQSNYASGNSFQDAMAVSLNLEGKRKCISLDIGLVLNIGFAAGIMDAIGSLKRLGYISVTEKDVHFMLNHVCNPNLPIPHPTLAQFVTGIKKPRSLQANVSMDDNAKWVNRPMFQHLLRSYDDQVKNSGNAQTETSGTDDDDNNIALLLTSAKTTSEAAKEIIKLLKQKLAKALWMPEGDIDAQKAIHAFGVDSLVGIELRYWISKQLRADVSVFEIMRNSTSVAALGLLIAERTRFRASLQ